MTTEVTVCISGNKEVLVTNGTSRKVMQPGSHYKFLIHGDVSLDAEEIGDFIPPDKQPILVKDFAKE